MTDDYDHVLLEPERVRTLELSRLSNAEWRLIVRALTFYTTDGSAFPLRSSEHLWAAADLVAKLTGQSNPK